MSDTKVNNKLKKRYWGAIVYPDSAPDAWHDLLIGTGLPFAVSPLHDMDVNPGTGEQKKAHWHLLLCFEGPTTYNNVCSVLSPLNCSIPVPVDHLKGVYRYFTHKDNPEKAQYSESDIRSYNGFNIADYVELTKSEVSQIVRELHYFIIANDILEYSDFLDLLIDNDSLSNPLAAYEVACNHTIMFNAYIRSRRHRARSGSCLSSSSELRSESEE